jgi:hypothetical protein
LTVGQDPGGGALFVGVANLLMVHGRRLPAASGSGYSLVIILPRHSDRSGLFGTTGYWSLWIINIQIPVETS